MDARWNGTRIVSALALLAATAACESSVAPGEVDGSRAAPLAAAQGGPPASAVMEFGRDVGADRPPTHPSFHAKDKVRPRTVVIRAGGTVHFDVAPAHQVGVYDSGTEPADIEVSPATLEPSPGPLFIPDFVIDDPDRRIGLGPELSFFAGYQWSFTFDEPGRYLVICTVTPHFVEAKMYGFVEVK